VQYGENIFWGYPSGGTIFHIVAGNVIHTTRTRSKMHHGAKISMSNLNKKLINRKESERELF